VPQPLQTVPSTPPPQFVLPVGAAPQTPSKPPPLITQLSVQHSPSWAQASPVWTQNDEPAQNPWLQ
jgi:hypothetical protein